MYKIKIKDTVRRIIATIKDGTDSMVHVVPYTSNVKSYTANRLIFWMSHICR